MRITAPNEIQRDDLDGAPDGPWFDALIEYVNAINRQVVAALDRNITTEDNTVDKAIVVDLVDGVRTPQKNPLAVPIEGILPVRCSGVNVDSAGRPTRGTYELGMPRIDWVPSKDGGAFITATFPTPAARGRVRLYFFGG